MKASILLLIVGCAAQVPPPVCPESMPAQPVDVTPPADLNERIEFRNQPITAIVAGLAESLRVPYVIAPDALDLKQAHFLLKA